MPRFDIVTEIAASPEVCFDLSRDLDFHTRSFHHTQETAVAGRTSGLIELGEEVTWRAKHFWIWHHHTARITKFTRPHHFRDEMTRGRFKRFVHDHHFKPFEGGTRMRDVVEFESPWGLIGRMADSAFLTRYMKQLIQLRCDALRSEAEGWASSTHP